MPVRSSTTKFGDNAGKIWKVLHEHGVMKEQLLLDLTQLTAEDFYAGVGWLAREDKIRKENDSYQLGNTNLTEKVGAVAGKIWKILDIWEEADLETIKRLTSDEEKDIFAALGWLAREDKINVDETQTYRLR